MTNPRNRDLMEVLQTLSGDVGRLSGEMIILRQGYMMIRQQFDASQWATTSLQNSIDLQRRISRAGIASIRQGVESLQSSLPGFEKCSPQFTLFPKLPPELRLRIWKIACFNEPRIIVLHVGYDDSGHHFYCKGDYIPSVLQATSESRSEALKWYERKAVNHGRYEETSLRLHRSYFNFHNDILCLNKDANWYQAFPFDSCNWAEILTKHRTIRQFRRIAIEVNDKDAVFDEFDEEWERNARFILHPRSKIKEIFCVTDGLFSFETDQQFRIVGDDEVILRSNLETNLQRDIIVADRVKKIRKILTAEIEALDDGIIEEDPPSDDEFSVISGEGIDGQELPHARSKKTLPTITFASLREPQSTRPPRIFFA